MIAYREFARRDGCDESLVRRAVRSGALPRLPGRQLPADLVGTAWRAGNAAALEVQLSPPTDGGLAAAEREREIALARLRQRQLQQRLEEWTDVAQVLECWSFIRETCTSQITGLGATLRHVATEHDQIRLRALVRDTVHDTLTRLASAELIPTLEDPRPPEDVGDHATTLVAKTAKTKAIAGLRQLELAIAEGRVLHLAAWERGFGDRLSNLRDRLLSWESGLPPLLLGADASVQGRAIESAVHDVLQMLPEEMPAVGADDRHAHADAARGSTATARAAKDRKRTPGRRKAASA
ncbi:MAG: hypothetical protein J0H67_08425 [Rhodospirillales bacterium]|nr:hypothetical protein [Rhodospirillales bacterium]